MRPFVKFKVTFSYLFILFIYLNMDFEYGLFPWFLTFAIAENTSRSNSSMFSWFNSSAIMISIVNRGEYEFYVLEFLLPKLLVAIK